MALIAQLCLVRLMYKSLTSTRCTCMQLVLGSQRKLAVAKAAAPDVAAATTLSGMGGAAAVAAPAEMDGREATSAAAPAPAKQVAHVRLDCLAAGCCVDAQQVYSRS